MGYDRELCSDILRAFVRCAARFADDASIGCESPAATTRKAGDRRG